MEKLKVKHDHTLTDILKVGIFGIFLILPILMFLPNCLYYAFNEHAQVNTTTQPVYEYKNVDFNQLIEQRIVDTTNQYFSITENINFQENHIYIFKPLPILNFNGAYYLNSPYTDLSTTQPTSFTNISTTQGIFCYNADQVEFDYTLKNQLFDLTQMFGRGNEPTITEFEEWYPESYYPYTLSKKEVLEIETEDTVTVTETTKNIEYAWKSLWQGPILTWTNNNNFIFTINLFTNIFAVSQESYLTNYLTYILTITAIYLIFDIVFVLITKLTHLINSK